MKNCDICNQRFKTGMRFKVLEYKDHQNWLTKRWRVIKRRRKIFVCSKCLSIGRGLVINYRRK